MNHFEIQQRVSRPTNWRCRCPVCGGDRFHEQKVLWPELIAEWQLAPEEVEYIDQQQGFACLDCGNNLRAMTLAAAISRAFEHAGHIA